jgi:hypothetical protein
MPFSKIRGVFTAADWNASAVFLIALTVPSLVYLTGKDSSSMPALYVAMKYAQDSVIAIFIFKFGKFII